MSISGENKVISKGGVTVGAALDDWGSHYFVLKLSEAKSALLIRKEDAGTLAIDILRKAELKEAAHTLEGHFKREREREQAARRNKRALELWKEVGGSKRLEEGTPEWALLMKLVEQEEKSGS